MLTVNNLSYEKGKKVILDAINMQIVDGRIIGILGPNGAGKSTLMQALSGYIAIDEDAVTIDGKADRDAILMHTTYMNHELSFPRNWNGKDILACYRESRKDFNFQRFMGMTKALDIDLTMKIKNMSRGEREKLILSLTLSQEVPYYFLDEPLTGIDVVTREEILKSLLTFASPEATIIISSHYIDIFEMLLEEVFFISSGKIMESVDPEEIRDSGKTLTEYYKGLYQTIGGGPRA